MDGMERQVRRGGLTGPVILISLGIVLLLNNLEVLPWTIWEVILYMWPLLLIVAGLDLLIGRRSVWGSLLVLVLMFAVLAGGAWLFWAYAGTSQAPAGEEIRQALDGATRAEVVIAPAIGTLHIDALPESARLVEGVIRPVSGEQVMRDFTVKGKTATFTLRSGGAAFFPFTGGWSQRGWDLGLNPDVSLQLEVSLGLGESEVDLTGLTVSDLDVDMGIGQTKVILPDEGRVQAKVDGAIGQTVVVIPAGMAARIRVDTALSSSRLPDDYQRQDKVYTSPGYESAENRIDLEVSQAIGNIVVRHSEGE